MSKKHDDTTTQNSDKLGLSKGKPVDVELSRNANEFLEETINEIT